jgi:hypothetical protein
MRREFFLLVVLLALPLPASAWGPRGHAVVAHLAAMNLTPQAHATVATLLGGEAEAMMAISANWADEVRDARPQTAHWHYVNLAIGGDLRYRPGRDCPREACVVAQIARQEAVLRSNAPRERKTEALKYLIHFAGDIQQPLHAADNDDRGGNRVLIRWRGQRITLHHFWDDEMVALQGRDARAIDQSSRRQAQQLGAGSPSLWAERSAVIARDTIYPRTGRPPSLTEVAEYGRIARTQLARSGYALAARLNAILK